MFADWLQYRWDLLITTWFGNNLFAMNFYGTLAIVYCMFWTVGLFYLFVDTTGRPSFLLKYKIQEPYTPVVYNQTVVMLPLFYLLARALEWRQFPTGQLPSLARIVTEAIGYLVLYEIGFYYTHRLLHYGPLYRLIHKRHHRWQAPVAMSSFYCHPVEHVISNIMPVFIGPFVLGSHLFIQWGWYGAVIFVTLAHHSGYHFPCMISSEYHDYHHLKFNQNFGTFGLLDWIHGTNNEFYKSIAYKRHRVFMSCQPIKQLYPDESQNISSNNNNNVKNK
ncbi:fatty acid hydroxylase domain-containing protein 2-like isoform X2 [Oppia nitens]|uniref:fatty acid hydroxylase domain-containing protein 2-like isoform X2 n=1 Tax=Oppia nitens TaxID=1686743 RepID=UPI0023DB9F35|nr:fatty acid hydroxylase domain-containing protein 2-like isoform X2 [Oppia nitens]